MKQTNKKDTVNLFFSAFLIIAFIVCAHFFTQFTSTLPSMAGTVVSILIYIVFGLLVFYATRVGDGKAVKRFSLVTLIVMVIPSLYIIVASIAPGMPLYSVFASASTGGVSVIVTLACIALGYGIPYTFLSGYEVVDENAVEEVPAIVEGGVEADIAEITEETTAEVTEEVNNEETEAVSEETEQTDSDNAESEKTE